jgi:hypothetical protein
MIFVWQTMFGFTPLPCVRRGGLSNIAKHLSHGIWGQLPKPYVSVRGLSCIRNDKAEGL